MSDLQVGVGLDPSVGSGSGLQGKLSESDPLRASSAKPLRGRRWTNIQHPACLGLPLGYVDPDQMGCELLQPFPPAHFPPYAEMLIGEGHWSEDRNPDIGPHQTSFS